MYQPNGRLEYFQLLLVTRAYRNREQNIMKWTGGCLCGEVRYKISADPEWAGYCHCSMCRKQTGAPVTVGVQFPRGAVEWSAGKPTLYQSSEDTVRGFCVRCGSTLTWETPSRFTVFVGSLDQPESIRPGGHGQMETQLPWLTIEDELPRAQSTTTFNGDQVDR